jgi:hypothetical protein
MIAKSFLIGLLALGASIGAAQATHIGDEEHAPLAGVELGERLSKPSEAAALPATPKAEPVVADADAPPVRAERKVRVVYPLPR